LRNGEVWGKWKAGTGPRLGFTADPSSQGAIVMGLEDAGPATAAGMQKGDLIVKVDGQPTRGLDEIYNILAERDPYHEATVELLRNGQGIAVKIKLAPRTP
jgi:S1-C subfamily serine protease